MSFPLLPNPAARRPFQTQGACAPEIAATDARPEFAPSESGVRARFPLQQRLAQRFSDGRLRLATSRYRNETAAADPAEQTGG
jgi:hypothetical protein